MANPNPRKRSKTEDPAEDNAAAPRRPRLTRVLREAIALAASSGVDDVLLDPLLDKLATAYHLACTPSREWNWTLDAATVLAMDEGDRQVFKEIVGSRAKMEAAGIIVQPLNWDAADEPTNWRAWLVHLPGLPRTHWAGAVLTLTMSFPETPGELQPHALLPKKLRFLFPLFHPNVYPSGTLQEYMWSTQLGDKVVRSPNPLSDLLWATDDADRLFQLLHAAQHALENHMIQDPAQAEAYSCFRNDPAAYYERIRRQTLLWTPDPASGLDGRPILNPSVPRP